MTPMMQQYFEIKNQYKDYLVFYRLGDFYEMFFDDAILASRELELTLTGRDCGEEERAPMCGVPFHSAENYISKLIEKGYKVAICEQVEDPATAKGLVRREIVRIITPGTVIEAEMLSETSNNYLCSVCVEQKAIGVAFADISTAQIFATTFEGDSALSKLINEIGTYAPRELLINTDRERLPELYQFVRGRLSVLWGDESGHRFGYNENLERVRTQFSECIKESELENRTLVSSLGALLGYIAENQKGDISYIKELHVYTDGQYMQLDNATRRNLELTESMRAKEKKGSLLWVLGKTKTSPGARLLRQWIEHPLLSIPQITKRQNAVSELLDGYMMRADLEEQLDGVLDLERLLTKIIYGSANARDLRGVSATLERIPAIRELIASAECGELAYIHRDLDSLGDIYELINKSITETPPITIREGGMIADGVDPEIDRLREIKFHGKEYIEKLAEEERERTGIKTLKIGYNRVFGYYIEVTRSLTDKVPERYIRKQTLTGSERYITPELKEYESTVLGASDKLAALEYELFCKIRSKVAEASERIRRVAAMLAKLDVYCALASVAAKNNFVCPKLNNDGVIDIRDGRHPVVELFVKDAYFVPNDTHFDMKDNRLMIITGPNMAGKSTYMRQVALIAIMTQIGSFVPAAAADMCICDRVFTRVGASDDLASGQSTFMLEMNEVATILKNATKNSLIIYDEVGRGTSTFDGMSIARAILEYTHSKKVGSKTLFATHYHELTSLEEELSGVVNYNIAARKHKDGVVFLRKIVRGSTDDSYGIEVAKLAGLPGEVIRRAREVLLSVEAKAKSLSAPENALETPPELDAVTLDDCIEGQIIDDLRAMDLNNLSPFEAMGLLYEMQKKLK